MAHNFLFNCYNPLDPMKTTFKFYFLMIIGAAFLSALVYGLAGTLVEKYITVFSFGLMLIVVGGIAGMMHNLTMVPASRR